jgi:hypothetical protein
MASIWQSTAFKKIRFLKYNSANMLLCSIDYYEAHPEHMKYGITYLRGALEGVSGNLDGAEYLEALAERRRLRLQVLEDLRGYDACLMTGPTHIMHFVGLPSLGLRLGMADDGTPRG